jgi:4-hydroxy-2-oxoheptanedioate aldolase
MRTNGVKRKLRQGQTSIGTWLSLGSILAARFMARAGFDWLTVDIEHTCVDWETATHMFAAIAEAGCVPLGRVPMNRLDHIKRVLDNGAYGIVVPMVNSRKEAEEAVAAAKYPPQGVRSVGGNVHALNFDATASEYYEHANEEILVVLQCEHIEAVRRADEIFSVPGIDAIFVGPNDLAWSMRSADGRPPSSEAFEQALSEILAACRRHGVAAGLHCMSVREAQSRIAQGWQFVAISSELRMMLDGAALALQPFLGERRSEGVKY